MPNNYLLWIGKSILCIIQTYQSNPLKYLSRILFYKIIKFSCLIFPIGAQKRSTVKKTLENLYTDEPKAKISKEKVHI